MRVLYVTNMYPTDRHPASGVFVADQIDSLRRAGVTTDLLLAPRLAGGPLVYRELAARLRERTNRQSCDLIHVMYGGVMAEIVTRHMRDFPVVVSFCGSDLLGPARDLKWIRALSVRYGVHASRRAARRAKAIIVKSGGLATSLNYRLDRDRAHVIPNGVDLDRFKPMSQDACREHLGWEWGTHNVLFAGSASNRWKRPGLAEAATAELRGRGVRVRLRMMSGLPHDQVPTWLNASDLMLLTSIHEGSPNILKEALACGVPCVSVDVGDAATRLAPPRAGRLAKPTPLDLAEKIGEVLGWPRHSEAIEGIQELSMERIAARIVSVYEQVLA